MAALAKRVRRILDQGGLPQVNIFASGNMDEWMIHRLLADGSPIDGFGVGSRLDVSADAPYLDCAYKLQEYAGKPRRKRSAGKATWPGRKQVFRSLDAAGLISGDLVTLDGESSPGVPLVRQVVAGGQLCEPLPALAEIRQAVQENLARLPLSLRSLDDAPPYSVKISSSLRALAEQLDQA